MVKTHCKIMSYEPIIISVAVIAFIPQFLISAIAQDAKPAPAEIGKDALLETIDSGITVNNELISLDLKGIDITDFFRILSLKIGKSIVPTKGVSGKATFYLNGLTLEDTLDVILVTQDLACERKGKIIYIMTPGEYERVYGKKYNERRRFKGIKLNYAKPSAISTVLGQIKSDFGKIITDENSGTLLLVDIPEKLELLEQAIKVLDQPLKLEVFDLKYAKPVDMKTQLTGALTAGAGEIFTDDRTNRIVVSDLPKKMEEIKKLVDTFDIKSQQVFIEAEIVQIVLNKQFQRGVDWEKVFGQNSLKDLDIIGKFPVNPALSAYQKLTVGQLTRDNYTATMNFLHTYGNTKVLSRPRIAVINNQEAKILVGAREAYVSQTMSQAETTTVTSENIQFIDVGVKLLVVPTISKDGFVTMKIKPEVSSVRENFVTSLGSRIPIVETSEAETVVTVKDGIMVMLAGLMKEEKRDDNSGFPVLSRIPFIGGLFGARSTQNKQVELIVFLTPHIISGDVSFSPAETEKFVPKDIMPEDMKNALIFQELDKIKAKPLDTLPSLPRITEAVSRKEIGEKLKGIKIEK